MPVRQLPNGRATTSKETDTLRRLGLRLTPQRAMILAVVESQKGHFCADDVYVQVRQRHPTLSLSTVYRTLDQLEKVGLIVKSDLGGGKEEYHWAAESRHHHLVCLGCGTSLELESGVVDKFRESLQNMYGFDPDLSHMAIFGHCAGCQDKGEAQYGT